MTDLQKSFSLGAKMKVETKPKVDHTPAELDDVSKALLAAADYIDKNGWIQEYLGSDVGPVCALGGIYYANYGRTGIYCDAAGRVMESVGGRLDSWNDQPGRTKDEVVSKLRAVALGL
jgi:hypothetical protein